MSIHVDHTNYVVDVWPGLFSFGLIVLGELVHVKDQLVGAVSVFLLHLKGIIQFTENRVLFKELTGTGDSTGVGAQKTLAGENKCWFTAAQRRLRAH